jgi:hypothetical protein
MLTKAPVVTAALLNALLCVAENVELKAIIVALAETA